MFPEISTAKFMVVPAVPITPTGKLSSAVVAEIPSPLYPAASVPATVEIIPVEAVIYLIAKLF